MQSALVDRIHTAISRRVVHWLAEHARAAEGDGVLETGLSQAFGGALHTVFLKTDNTIWSMGYNGYGQLGDYTTNDRSTPAQFDVNATAIAVGGYHTLAITLP